MEALVWKPITHDKCWIKLTPPKKAPHNFLQEVKVRACGFLTLEDVYNLIVLCPEMKRIQYKIGTHYYMKPGEPNDQEKVFLRKLKDIFLLENSCRLTASLRPEDRSYNAFDAVAFFTGYNGYSPWRTHIPSQWFIPGENGFRSNMGCKNLRKKWILMQWHRLPDTTGIPFTRLKIAFKLHPSWTTKEANRRGTYQSRPTRQDRAGSERDHDHLLDIIISWNSRMLPCIWTMKTRKFPGKNGVRYKMACNNWRKKI